MRVICFVYLHCICSLSILSSLASLGGDEANVDGFDGTAGLALLANEVIYTLLLLVSNSRLIRVAIDALHIVIGVPPDGLREVLRLVATREDHLTVVTDDAVATQLGQEVGEDVRQFTVEGLGLLLEVVPARLGGGLRRLRGQQRERLLNLVCHTHNYSYIQAGQQRYQFVLR